MKSPGRNSVTLADGGWSTALAAAGWLPSDGPAELAVRVRPAAVQQLVRAYLAAGAEIVSTNTFATNPLMWQRRGRTEDALDLSQAAAGLVREIVGPHGVRVAGVIGPSGALLALREVSEGDLAECFARQAEALQSGGADLIQLETFSDLGEALIALRAAREATGLPVLAMMSFDSGPQRTRTAMGHEADRCAVELEQAGAEMIGCNCGAGAGLMLPAVVALRSNTSRPVCARPSAGLPDLEGGRPVYSGGVDDFATAVVALVDAGAQIVGGCCGTGPEHIRRLAALLGGAGRTARPRARGDRSAR